MSHHHHHHGHHAERRHDLNGRRVQNHGENEIYLVEDGFKRHIPDPQTYDSLFRDWNGILHDVNVHTIETGSPIPSGSQVAQAHGEDAVYFVDGYVKHHIASPEAMDRFHFKWPHHRVEHHWIHSFQTVRTIY
jgi:hypothetical protein